MTTPINPVLVLFLKSLALYIVWYVGYEIFLAPDGRLDLFLNENITKAGTYSLNLLGFDASIIDGHIIYMNNTRLSIGSPCNGLVLYALFSGFVIAMPGKLINKLWFSAVGMLFLYAINVFRVVILSLNMQYYPQSFDFNHRYVYQIAVYAVIFFLWHTWVKRFSGLYDKSIAT
jgi:exosortase family protein XrtF